MAHPYQSTVRNLTSPRQPQGRDSLFSWTVGLFVLAGVVVACWLGSFYVTGHPEQPTMYSILRSANQVGAQARFETTAAPQGKFLSAKDAFDSFSQMTSLQLDHENAKLLRNYIRNYKELARPVPYLHGKFVVIQAYSLSKSDFISEGLVVLTQAVDHPQVLVEVICPAPSQQLRAMAASFTPGNEIKFEKTLDLSAVVHVARISGGYFQLSVVPIQYGTLGVRESDLAFSLDPPKQLKVGETLPVIHSIEVNRLMKSTADLRRAHKDAVAQGKVRIIERLEGRVDGDPNAPSSPLPSAIGQLAATRQNARPTASSTPPPLPPSDPPPATTSQPPAATQPASALITETTTPTRDSTPLIPQPELPDMKNPAAIAKTPTPSPLPPQTEPESETPTKPAEGGPAGMNVTSKTGNSSKPDSSQPTKSTPSIPKASLVKAPSPSVTPANTPPANRSTSTEKPPKSAPPLPKALPVASTSTPPTPTNTRPNVNFRDVVSGSIQTPTKKILRGKFVVTATGSNQAVLRPMEDPKLGRVIVEYPRGSIPNNGQVIDADSASLEIVQISQSPDGTKTVRVREAQ
jgi:hypothetical protein